MTDVSKTKRQPYGAGSVYLRAHDNRWVGTIEAGYTKTGGRRRITVTAKTEAECKRKLRDRRKEIEREGEATPVGRTTVKAWADEWVIDRATKDRPKTHTTDRGAVLAWIVPTIGHKRLDKLTPADVKAVTSALRAAGKSTSTAKRYHGVLIRMLKAAVQEGHNVPPRVLAVLPPEKAAHDRTALTVPETLAALEVASHLDHGSRWSVAFLDGLRQGEALGLTWPMVDLEAEALTISWQMQSLPYLDPRDRAKGFRVPDGYEARHLSGAYHLVRPKSKAGWRVIPLVPWAAGALRTWRTKAPASPHGLVWPNAKGGPANIRHDAAEWQAIQSTANIGHPEGRYYHGHEIRHSAATLLMELGVPESVIIAILGHSSILVSRGYMHRGTDQAREALARVAERLQLR
jgi:integrase